VIRFTESGKQNWGSSVYYRQNDLDMRNLTKSSVDITAMIEQTDIGVTAMASEEHRDTKHTQRTYEQLEKLYDNNITIINCNRAVC